MPDIKSALSAALLRPPANVVMQKTLEEWDDEGEKHFPINISSVGAPNTPAKSPNRNNVMRETFNCVLNNPGLTAKEISNKMAFEGFKASSVTSVVSQLCRSGQLLKDRNTYRTVNDVYVPILSKYKPVSAKKAAQASQGIAALTPAPAPAPVPVPVHKPFEPKDIIEPLNVYQAYDLYRELKEMFGV
jgi:hypothetical protein